MLTNLDAELYDCYVGDWPGELPFYHALAADARSRGEAVLEIGCGTGRIAIRLAASGVPVTGLDTSGTMLDVARARSAEGPTLRWVQADMRSFDLPTRFGLVIIPGHAFQFMHTAQDQAAALACIQRHMTPGGTLVVHLDHQDVPWLGEIEKNPYGHVERGGALTHPASGALYRAVYAWAYERATQTAVLHKAWERLDMNGSVLERIENEPMRLHCVFRNEMEHLARRAGFDVDGVYGDFFRHPLGEGSAEMVWVLKDGRPQAEDRRG